MQLDEIFWVTIVVIFSVSIISAIVRTRQKDKCLRLLHDYHVTLIHKDGKVTWGDLFVSSVGVELMFDAVYETGRSIPKSSALMFPDDLVHCLAMCRTVHALTKKERKKRHRQVRRTFRPGPIRRISRWLQSLLNTIRDAFHRTIGVLATSFGRAGAVGAALQSQKGTIEELGGTLINVAGHAYEPLLERHIGRPVVLEIKNPEGAAAPFTELPGYLVEYTQNYLAVFNVAQDPLESFDLEIADGITHASFDLSYQEKEIVLASRDEEPLIIRRVSTDTGVSDLSVLLLPGAKLPLHRDGDQKLTVSIERVRTIDVVCPRATARIRFGSDKTRQRSEWFGRAPGV